MADPRAVSVRAAEKTTRELKKLFNRLGSVEHPRGQVLSAYRNAHRGMRDVLKRNSGAMAAVEAREVLDGLRRDVESVARETLENAADLGLSQANTEYAAWGLEGLIGEAVPVDVPLQSWLGVVDQQTMETLAVIVTGGDAALILGDETRQGFLRAGPVINTGAKWLTSVAVLSYVGGLAGPTEATGEKWGKQAIAAIDGRTTDCCLNVAGQVVPFEGKFKLTGTPRFADEMEWSPFHWYCRTSIVMVPMRLADDDVTQRVTNDAQKELEKRG